MTQAARSGKVNIVEGSATSKETEMKLTDVARASLAELQSDYEDWLLRHGQAPWEKDSVEAKAVFGVRLDLPEYGDDYVRDSCLHLLAQQKMRGILLFGSPRMLDLGSSACGASTNAGWADRRSPLSRRRCQAEGNIL